MEPMLVCVSLLHVLLFRATFVWVLFIGINLEKNNKKRHPSQPFFGAAFREYAFIKSHTSPVRTWCALDVPWPWCACAYNAARILFQKKRNCPTWGITWTAVHDSKSTYEDWSSSTGRLVRLFGRIFLDFTSNRCLYYMLLAFFLVEG